MNSFFLVLVSILTSTLSFAQTSWADRISMKGDFRFRGDSIHDETLADPNGYDRNRLRLRARLQFKAQVNEQTDAIFRFASGSTTEESTNSTNQDLTDYGSKKGLNLDLAYANWKFRESAEVWFGKSPYVYFQPGNSDMVLDTDITTEGISYRDSWKSDSYQVFWNTGYWLVDELHTSGVNRTDVAAVGGDAGVQFQSDKWSFLIGAGYINFTNIKGAPVATNATRGNSTVSVTSGGTTTEFYTHKYELNRGFAEIKFPLFEMPATLYFDYVQNSNLEDHNEGRLVGLKVGQLKEVGNWMVSWDYRDVDADATLGVLAESDTGGGGTNLFNSRYTVGYQLAQGTSASLAYSQGVRRANAGGAGTDYQRILLDLVYNF